MKHFSEADLLETYYMQPSEASPIIEHVNDPTQQCWNETVTTREYLGAYTYAPVERTVQHCRTVASYRDEIRGYDVVYRYNGRDVHIRLPYDPGPTVRLDVTMVR